jgi:F-type H+-transporting ATPase subunit gamma
MAVGKEIRGKITSMQNTKKITKAMEMVSVSKMRKAQERMRAARPYSNKIRDIAANLSQANPEYMPAFMQKNEAKAVGFIVITTDKGLCGGLNTNMLRLVTQKILDAQSAGMDVQTVAFGNKGFGFLNRIGAKVVAHATQLGDTPHLDKLIGPVKVLLDAYAAGKLSAVYLCYTDFINTMKQEPRVQQLLPLSVDQIQAESKAEGSSHGWDYIYEPDAQTVIDELLTRYIAVGPHGCHESSHRQRNQLDRRAQAGLQQNPPSCHHQRVVRNRFGRCGGGLINRVSFASTSQIKLNWSTEWLTK